MNFLSAIRLAQSILKRKFPSVYKSLQKISLSKRAFKKYKPCFVNKKGKEERVDGLTLQDTYGNKAIS